MSPLPIQLVDIAEKNLHRLREASGDRVLVEQHSEELRVLLGMSDFISDILVRYPKCIGLLFEDGLLHQETIDHADLLETELQACEDEIALHRTLRHFRHLHMTRIAARDLLGMQSIQSSLADVSALAEAVIGKTTQWLQRALEQRYGRAMVDGEAQSMLVLGMGKLGGGELNFSSDIDLIFCYAAAGNTQGGTKSLEHQQFFTRLGQKLITALNQQTIDGQVFRVDMRLRPFGDSGPLVCNFAAMEDYYQDQGREWERYAMLKSRVMASTGPHASELSDILKPFVYRRYLDYGVFESLRAMKTLIQKEVRRRRLDHDIKLGQGGIREAEFVVQSFQLVRGGREPSLQVSSFVDALSALTEHKILESDEAADLKEAYLFLRKVEHCLQQFADQQTQSLPDNERDQYRLCYAMGYEQYADFLDALQPHRDVIHRLFLSVIGDDETTAEPLTHQTHGNLQDIWLLDLDAAEAKDMLVPWLNEDDISNFYDALQDFRRSLQRRGVGQKGTEALNELMPVALTLMVEQQQLIAVELLPRLLGVLGAIVGRTTYLQLLNEHPGALAQLIKLCASSPWITEQIERFPILLDELLNPASLYTPIALEEYAPELRRILLRIAPDDLELQMETLRQFKLSQQLRIAAADVTHALPVMKVSDHLTQLAEAIVQEVVGLAWHQMVDKYGAPKGFDEHNKGFAVLGYGKLGGLELGYGSDLDLVFLHLAPPGCQTLGIKPIEAGRFYTKLAQRIMHLFSTKMASGVLYEVDMRLRPSGNAGLLVCHIDGFATYQHKEAWTWEHQALVRARTVYCTPEFARRFDTIRRDVLARVRDETALKYDVRTMREKMREHLVKDPHSSFDIKQGVGGIADIEFLVQYWVLAHSHRVAPLVTWSDNVRILETLSQADLIDTDTAQTLREAYLEYRNTSHILTLQGRDIASSSDHFLDVRKKVSEIWRQVFDSPLNNG